MLCHVILFDRLSSFDILVYLNALNHEIISTFYKTILVIKYQTQGQAKRLLQKYCPQNMVESLKRVRRLVNNLYKPTDSKWLILVTKKTTNTKEEEQRFLSSMVFSVYEVFRITYITNQLCNWKVMQTTLLTLTDMQERTLCSQGIWTPNVFLECYCFKDL